MTEEEMREHAKRILKWHIEDIEYCAVYEDDELEESTEEEWDHIYHLINSAKVTITWN